MASVTIPWGAWYEMGFRRLSFPGRYELLAPPVPDGPDLGAEAIRRALEQPVGSPPLAELARGRSSVAVAVDDLTRPTPAGRLLPWVLETIDEAGIGLEAVTVVVASGAHRPLQRSDLLKKLGPDVVGRLPVFSHSPYDGLVDYGTTPHGTPIQINRWFARASLKITLGAVLPHPSAGFGGGAKIVLAGLGSLEALERNHGPAVREVAGRVGEVEGNALRADLEEALAKVGVDFCINVVSPAVGVVAAVVAGHPVASHRAACAEARRLFTVSASPGPVDIVCVNAYPKDTEFLQVTNAFNVWADRTEPLVAPGGTLVVLTAASEGLGTHGLLGPGGPLYRPLAERAGFDRLFEGRAVAVVCPTISRRELELLFPPSAALFADWPACRAYLEDRHPASARVAVFGASALQLLETAEGEA
ncbi:MAG: lactate racemase domain-containing protein [Candidatus Tectimicrobiota bacterium]